MFVTTCCIFKSTPYIYLFSNCKEEWTFSTRPRVLRDQISQEILLGIIIFLCHSNIYFLSFKWSSKLHSKNKDKTVFIRSWIFHILAILLRTSQVNSLWVLKLHWPGKPAILVWQRKYHADISFTRNFQTVLRSLEAFLFQMNRDNNWNSIDLILVGKCPLSVIRL